MGEGEEIDEREPVDYNPGLPLYAVDQSKGPLNGDLVERHAALSEQLADLRRSGCYDLARQTKKSLERLEAATPGLIAQRMAANG
ncbi:hypothetical protein [Sphingobium agri]|uniref:Uncharacterized protein n=1 Tax=Sphingobium agri TaxID=2933566 RepID=A0ABT0DX90_9SPHN|nr:hypothetical protein [Sphingobium agri]MCK0531582.1 hypothetical protein [Sphingobium agri]